MVQPNTEARPRRSRTRRGEEQAPLVESQLNVTNDVIMDGEGDICMQVVLFAGMLSANFSCKIWSRVYRVQAVVALLPQAGNVMFTAAQWDA